MDQPKLTVDTPTYAALEAAYLGGEATMPTDRVNHREFVWNGIRYKCGWSSQKFGDGVLGWIVSQG